MKTLIITLGVLLALIPQTVVSHEDETHKALAKHEKDGQTQTLKGQIIGMTCFIQHGAKGATHKDCAKECAQKGLPLGLLTDQGKLYQIMGKGHEDLKTVNARLMDYIEENVVVVGKTFKAAGVNALVIQKIKKQ